MRGRSCIRTNDRLIACILGEGGGKDIFNAAALCCEVTHMILVLLLISRYVYWPKG